MPSFLSGRFCSLAGDPLVDEAGMDGPAMVAATAVIFSLCFASEFSRISKVI